MKLSDLKETPEYGKDVPELQQKLEKWASYQHNISRWDLTEHRELLIDGNVHQNSKIPMHPLKIFRVTGSIEYDALPFIDSWDVLPRDVGADLIIRNCPIKTLEGMTHYIGGTFSLLGSGINSFSGIHKHLKYCRMINLPATVQSSVLGLMFIDGLTKVGSINDHPKATFEILEAALGVTHILEKHLRRGRDVHMCQEELINAGYAQYAKL